MTICSLRCGRLLRAGSGPYPCSSAPVHRESWQFHYPHQDPKTKVSPQFLHTDFHFSSPIASFAYRLDCVTIISQIESVRKYLKISTAEGGIVTVGPTSSRNGATVIGASVELH